MSISLSEHFTNKKLIKFTLPSIAMMIFTSIYMIVDGFFVSNFAGKTAFAAINLIMPILMILGTIGFMFGAGGTALVSKTYGEGEKEKASRYFSLIVYFALAVGIVLSLIVYVFIEQIAILLGATGKLLEDCVLYARISLIAMPFYILQVMFQSFFSAAEKPTLGLIITLSSGFMNIILDAILVILLPQEHKLLGAALASGVAQMVGAIIPLIYFLKKNGSIFRLGKTRYDGKAIIKACTNGSSEFMTNIAMSFVGILYNFQLMKFAGENGIAAYGVMMYVSMIFSAVFFGFAMGVSPIVGYNYGAQNHNELKNLIKKGLWLVGIFGALMVLSAELLSFAVCKIFVGYDQKLLEITTYGFRIFALCFIFSGFGIFTSAFFTALNDGLISALIAFLRTMVFHSIAIYVLPNIFGIDGVWFSIVVAEFMSLVLSAYFLIIKKKKYNY